MISVCIEMELCIQKPLELTSSKQVMQRIESMK